MFVLIYFMLIAVAASLPAVNKDQELSLPLTAEDLQGIDKIILNITVISKESSKLRQDEDLITDIGSESGGLQLATHIVNILLKGFQGIGNALVQTTGTGGAGGAAGGGASGTATTGTGAAAALP